MFCLDSFFGQMLCYSNNVVCAGYDDGVTFYFFSLDSLELTHHAKLLTSND